MSEIMRYIGDDISTLRMIQITKLLELRLKLRWMLEFEVRNGLKA